jgi:hypothetical protein
MNRCVLVSANAGWNLLIGTSEKGKGAWISLDDMGVPEPCRTVFEEAEKDSCFRDAALARIAASPLDWAALAPAKLRATFDHPAAPAHYLHMSNPKAFDRASEVRLAALETVWQRLLLVLALLGLATGSARYVRLRRSLAALGVGSLVTLSAVPALLCVVLLCLLPGGPRPRGQPQLLFASVVVATALMHALFFGAGRYSLVSAYLMCAVAAAGFSRRAPSP